MDIAPTRSLARSLPRRLIPARALAILAVVVLSVAGVTATATAAPQSRTAEPFMAGTDLKNADGRGCTAGLVLKDNSTFGGVTEYQRSVRFILTAGHCGSVGDSFTTSGGRFVGDVTWKSATHDLLLIKVEPRLDRGVAAGCTPGSGTLPCVAISSHYYPRAVGRVFTGGWWMSESAPVRGTTMSGIPICFSGAYSGTICELTSFQPPPDFPVAPDPPGAQDLSYARGPACDDGDSGSPLYSSNGNVFGIMYGEWVGGRADGSQERLGVTYTPVSLFFAQQSGYALAPPE